MLKRCGCWIRRIKEESRSRRESRAALELLAVDVRRGSLSDCGAMAPCGRFGACDVLGTSSSYDAPVQSCEHPVSSSNIVMERASVDTETIHGSLSTLL